MQTDTPSTIHSLLQTHCPDGISLWQRVEELRQQDDAANVTASLLDQLLTLLEERLARNQALQDQLIHEGLVRSARCVLELLVARTRTPSLPPQAHGETINQLLNQGEIA